MKQLAPRSKQDSQFIKYDVDVCANLHEAANGE